MAEPRPSPLRRDDARARAESELERRRRRAPASRFWHAVGLAGSVGWPIVLLSLGGVWLGRAIDARVGTGVRFTLMLLVLGASLGTFVALRAVRGPAS